MALTNETFTQINHLAPLSASVSGTTITLETLFKPTSVTGGPGIFCLGNDTNGTLSITVSGLQISDRLQHYGVPHQWHMGWAMNSLPEIQWITAYLAVLVSHSHYPTPGLDHDFTSRALEELIMAACTHSLYPHSSAYLRTSWPELSPSVLSATSPC